MKKVSLLAVISLAFLPGVASAVGFVYSPWYAQLGGEVQNQGRPIPLRDELGLHSSASHGWLIDDEWMTFSYQPLLFRGDGVLQGDANFGGATFTGSAQVRTEADFTDLAARFMWSPLRGLGVGITAKILDGEITVSEEGGDSATKTVSEVFPMATLEYSVPLMNFVDLGVEAAYIRFDDDEVLEMGLNFELRGAVVGFTVGWVEKRYDVADEGFRLNSRINGVFAQLAFYI